MKFITNVLDSIYNPGFYGELKHKPTSFTVYYVFKLSALLAFFITVFVFFQLYSTFGISLSKDSVVYTEVKQYLNQYFEDDLVLRFKDGTLSSNKQEPIVFPYLPEWDSDLEIEPVDKIENLLVLDTGNDFNLELFRKFNTLAFFAKDGGAFYDQGKDRLQMLDYGEIDPLVLKEFGGEIVMDKSKVNEYLEIALVFLDQMVPYFYMIGFLLTWLFMFVFTALGMFVFAIFTGLVGFILAKIFRKGGDYEEWYRKAIHADTAALILSWISMPIFYLFVVTFTYTAVVLVILLVNTFVADKN